MKSRQELKNDYQRREKPAGVFQIKNTANRKLLLGSGLNLEGPLSRHRFTLSLGSHPNTALQEDWSTHGADTFAFAGRCFVRRGRSSHTSGFWHRCTC